MRTARALQWRALTAGALALAWATTARAEEPPREESTPDEGAPEEPKGPPRPPLPPAPPKTRLPWDRHLEVGADLALVRRTGSTSAEGVETNVRFGSAVGYGFHAGWDVLRFLRVSAYIVRAQHELVFLPGALVLPGEPRAIQPSSRIAADPLRTLAFGARLAPTWPLGDRVRLWLSVGIGYDRFDFGRMRICEPGSDVCDLQSDTPFVPGGSDAPLAKPFQVHTRGASFFEVPLGLGASLELVRDWITLDFETTGAFLLGQGGEATRPMQAVDNEGRRRTIGGLPRPEGSFVQTLGLSLVL
jgi:hypothetical protein